MPFRPLATLAMFAAIGAALAAPIPPQQARPPVRAVKPVPKRVLLRPVVVKKAIPKQVVGKPKVALGKPVSKPIAAKLVATLLAPAAEKKAIQAKYNAMSLLVMRRDGNRLATLFMGMTTPNFVYRDKKGRTLTRTKLVAQLKAQMKMVQTFKRSGNRIAAFAMKGPVGTAQVISDFAMIFPNGKKTVTVAGQSTTTDTWIKRAGVWKLRSIRTLKESVKYDGKAM